MDLRREEEEMPAGSYNCRSAAFVYLEAHTIFKYTVR